MIRAQFVWGVCRTNRDDWKRFSWPHVFSATIQPGDRVKPTDEPSLGSLAVVQVVHTGKVVHIEPMFWPVESWYGPAARPSEAIELPIVEIELGL